MKKIFVVLLIIVAVFLFFLFDLDRLLTLEFIKSQQLLIHQYLEDYPFLTAVTFFLLYIIGTALSLPGAVVLTIAAGGFFGLIKGVVIVSFASTIGATLAFLVSRYLFKDTVQRRFGDKLKAVNDGVARDGAFYLFTLRLVPLFPFFIINLVMALTSIKTVTFFWVSQLGMLLGTIIYVNAGTQLSKIESLSGILSPSILFSFVLLGVFPFIAKLILSILKKRKVYEGYTRPRSYDRNLIVIGAGAAGLVSSYIAAAVKAKITLVEAHKMGGDCLNYGCIPSKAFIKSAKVAHQIRTAEHYGLEGESISYSFKKVMQRVHNIIKKVEPHDSIERYTELGVEVLVGYARIIDPWTVEIEKQDGCRSRLTTRSIIIASGASPFIPSLPGLEDSGYLTSDTLWDSLLEYESIPKRVVVLGGGPIGCELSQSFARLGAEVFQVERGERILKREDEDVSFAALRAMEGDGVNFLTETEAVRCEQKGRAKSLVVSCKGVEREIQYDVLICAVGRSARLTGFGLEDIGVETNRVVQTNEYLETLYPNIFAAGDVAGPYQFTHVAGHQAWYAAVNALFGQFKRFKVDYSVIPWTTFIEPEVARVGLNEQEAIEQGILYEVVRYGIDDLDRAIADGSDFGFVKVLTVPGKDKILGATIVGVGAGDMLAEFVLAMKHGLGLNKILGTIHTYPTMSEANKYAAGMWKKNHAPERLLAWIKKYHTWRRKAQ